MIARRGLDALAAHRGRLVFLCISGVCLVSHNFLMIITDWAGFALWASLVVSFVIVGFIGYLGHSLLTFAQPMSIHGLCRYLIGIGTGTAIAIPIIWFWKVGVALPMIVASPLASVCTIGINYVLVRRAIVRPVAGDVRPVHHAV